MSTSTATNQHLIIGIDPGLATSAVVALQLHPGSLACEDRSLRLVYWKGVKLPAETPQRRRKLGITKGDNNETRLQLLYANYDVFFANLQLDACSQEFQVFAVIEGLSRGYKGRAPDAMSVMSQGIFRALVLRRGWKYIALNGFELRRRLDLPGRVSKEDMFNHVRPKVRDLGRTHVWDEHTKDACALAVAGVQYLEELP